MKYCISTWICGWKPHTSLYNRTLGRVQDEPALIRHLLPVPSILATIRAHYWETPGPDALKQAYAGDLSPQELHILRIGLLEVVKVIMKACAAQDIAEDVQVCSASPLVVTFAVCHACARQTLLQHSTVCIFAVRGITRQQLADLQSFLWHGCGTPKHGDFAMDVSTVYGLVMLCV